MLTRITVEVEYEIDTDVIESSDIEAKLEAAAKEAGATNVSTSEINVEEAE